MRGLGLFDEGSEFVELAAPSEVDQAEEGLGTEGIEEAMIENHSKARTASAETNQKKAKMLRFGIERLVDVIVEETLGGVGVFVGEVHDL
jgi:hypothetical protein